MPIASSFAGSLPTSSFSRRRRPSSRTTFSPSTPRWRTYRPLPDGMARSDAGCAQLGHGRRDGRAGCLGAVTIAGIVLANERFPGLGIWAVAGLLRWRPAGHGASARRRAIGPDGDSGGGGSVLFVGVLVAFPSDVVDR